MTRPHRCAALLPLLILIGCTLERRPPPDDEPGAATDPDTADLDDARTFLDRLQEARAAGRMTFVRERLHPDALVVPEGGRRSGEAGASRPDGLEGLLVPAVGVEGWEATGRPIDGGGAALFVLRYPPDSTEAQRPLETVVLTADSAGWRIRLLVRALAGPDPPDT